MTQNGTKRHTFSRVTTLSIEQENAINLLLTGASDQSVSSRLKVGRSTLHRWRNYHPLFIAELSRRRTAGRESSLDTVRSLVPRAAETLRDQIVNGDGHLALAFLHRAGVFGTREAGPIFHADNGPSDIDSVVDEEVRRRRAAGRLPTPAASQPTNGSASGAGGEKPVSVVEPPITDEERDAVFADLLAEASSDAPLSVPLDAPAASAVADVDRPPRIVPVGDPSGASVVTTRNMASLA